MARTGNELLLTQLQAAKFLGRNTRIIRRWTRDGTLPTFTDPETGVVLYPKPALEQWALDQQAGALVSLSRGGGGHGR